MHVSLCAHTGDSDDGDAAGMATGGQEISRGGEPAAPEHHRPKTWRTSGAFWRFVFVSRHLWAVLDTSQVPRGACNAPEGDHFAGFRGYQRVIHEDCVIFLLQGAQLGMASKPHTGPSNEKSWDSQPSSDLD